MIKLIITDWEINRLILESIKHRNVDELKKMLMILIVLLIILSFFLFDFMYIYKFSRTIPIYKACLIIMYFIIVGMLLRICLASNNWIYFFRYSLYSICYWPLH